MADYSKVEELLFRGFLTSPVVVGGTPVVLKSLSNKEVDLVELRCPEKDVESWRAHAAWSLAYSTFLFNRINVLPNRDQILLDLVKNYQALSDEIVAVLLREMTRLNRKAADQIQYVQPYSFGPSSKQHWMMFKGTVLCERTCTGVPGTEMLGLNTHQRLWLYLNRIDEEEESFDRNWELAKCGASAHAPKGVRKINNRDKHRREKQAERREALYEGKGEIRYGTSEEIRILDESPEELIGQMKRAVRGEKDFHDLVVEAHERRIRENYETHLQDRRERTERQAELRQERLSEVSDSIPYVVYSEDEVDEEIREIDNRRWERFEKAAHEDPQVFSNPDDRNRLNKWGIVPDEVDMNPDDPFSHPLLQDTYDAHPERADYLEDAIDKDD